jgi:hypothetical protein
MNMVSSNLNNFKLNSDSIATPTNNESDKINLNLLLNPLYNNRVDFFVNHLDMLGDLIPSQLKVPER